MVNFPCGCSLKSLNKLPNTRVLVLELVALFIFKTGTCEAKNSWEFFVDGIFCFVKICFQKRATKMNRISLISPRNQQKVALLVELTMFAVGFRLLNFFAVKLWVGISFQIEDSLSTPFLDLFVRQLSQMR